MTDKRKVRPAKRIFYSRTIYLDGDNGISLWRKFGDVCKAKGQSISETIRELLKKYIKDNE